MYSKTTPHLPIFSPQIVKPRPKYTNSNERGGFVIAYGAVVVSGFLMGLLCGWVAWW